MARQRYTISNMPLRGGLMTAGQQGTVAEDQLWRAENASNTLDGMIWKRPGLDQWGQTLKYPTGSDALSFYEMFSALDLWEITDNSDNIEFNVADNKLAISVSTDSGGAATDIIGRGVEATQGDSDDADFSCRFTCRITNVQTGANGTNIIISMRGRTADSPYAIQIDGAGINYYATAGGGTWTEWTTRDWALYPRATIEVQYDDTADTLSLYVDDELISAIDTSILDNYSAFTVGSYIEIHATTNASLAGQYTFFMYDLMMDGADLSNDETPFTAVRLGAGSDFKTIAGSSLIERSLLVASADLIYRDKALKKEWTPLLQLTGGLVTFSQFGDELLIFDASESESSRTYRWDGQGEPELLDDAPPVRFGTEHRSRIFAAGDRRYPLRLYFSGSRQPNVWFAPDSDADGQEQFNEVTEAGYLVLPGKRGDEIVAIYGEYYGSCIICTNRGIWRITGSSPLSFAIENISQDTGATAQAGLERLGNDLWMAGRQGITTLQTVEQFGDVKTQMPSGPIADLWNPGLSNASIKVDQFLLTKASMAWNPTTNHMLFAFAKQGATDISSIMAYSVATGGWLGPWESDTTFVESVEIGSPVLQTVMHGTSIGKVAISDPNWKMDFADRITMKIESPYFSGRSLDKSFVNQTKTWKVLRIFLQGLGAWDINVEWQVDDETFQTSTESQNVFNLPTLGDDWRLDVDPDGRIHSNQLIGVIEIPLDVRGRYFKFTIETDDTYDGEDFVYQGSEIEFLADGPDKEQE